MAYVITEPCLGASDKSCVAVCPIDDCIQDGTVEWDGKVYEQLFINPELCIDCGICQPECPVDAIFVSDQLPDEYKEFAQINAAFHSK